MHVAEATNPVLVFSGGVGLASSRRRARSTQIAMSFGDEFEVKGLWGSVSDDGVDLVMAIGAEEFGDGSPLNIWAAGGQDFTSPELAGKKFGVVSDAGKWDGEWVAEQRLGIAAHGKHYWLTGRLTSQNASREISDE